MPKPEEENTEDLSRRLMDHQGQLTSDDMATLQESGHILAGRSHLARKLSEQMRQSAEEMKKEASRLLSLSQEIAADVETRHEITQAAQQQQHHEPKVKE